MVKLSIHHRGNPNSRYFAHVGYLGLTPVKVEGVVRTKIEADGKTVPASSIVASVRCIESRMTRFGVAHSNTLAEYTQILWTKPPGVEWAEIGETELPFKIVIPAKTPGYSCTNFQDYRVYWRVEAVMSHPHVFGVGSRQMKVFDLWLLRYDVPRVRRQNLLSPARFLQTSKPRAPVIRYQLLTPTDPVGPLDIVTIPIVLHPLDPTVVVRSISLIVERRMDLNETSVVPSSAIRQTSPNTLYSGDEEDSSNSTIRGNNDGVDGSASTLRLTNDSSSTFKLPRESASTIKLSTPANPIPAASTSSLFTSYTAESFGTSIEQRPLLSPVMTDLPSKSTRHNVIAADSQGPFTKDADGVYTKSLTLQWPALKPSSHWTNGETMQTEMINVRFIIRVKVIIYSPATGAETVELEERELILITTNESDRKLALTKYNEIVHRSKSKSPRRGKREPPSPSPSSDSTDTPVPSVPPVPPSAYSFENMKSSKPRRSTPSTSASAPSLRRPHTSAGPRDQTSRSHRRPDGGDVERERHRPREFETPPLPSVQTIRRPDTALPTIPTPSITTKSSSSSFFSSTLKSPSAFSYNRRKSSRPTSSKDSKSAPENTTLDNPGTVRAWERELERIEVQSRRSTNVLGFFRRARSSRPNTASSSASSTSESS